ncbi:MAG: sterol desaturase family protein [Hyphomonadaceae bacterium]|nr:sterol desaturase family protein [Hyphomonadaceae bacterium]
MLALKAVALIAWFATLAVAERAWPAAVRPPRSDGPRQLRNLSFWAANALMNPFITAPIGIAAASVALWSRPDLPFWLNLALDLLVLDLWTYAWHRANHEWPLLWRFHRVHHLDAFLDTTSAVRFHPGEVLISALARAPLIIVADIQMASILLFDALVTASALFHHSNVRLPHAFEAALRGAIVTPSHHWVHHHAVRADTDSCYGALLTVWDRLFGSWSHTPRTPDMPIGVEGERDAELSALAAAPFRVGRGASRR